MDEQPSALPVDLANSQLHVLHTGSGPFGEMPGFEGAGQLVECLRILVRRPRLREAPRSSNDVRMRGLDRGIPVLCLIRAEDGGALVQALARYLARARPRRMPHVVYRYPDATAGHAPGDRLEVTRSPATYQDAFSLAETLLTISRGLASGANGGGGRIRFHRFGLVRWLISQKLEDEDGDSDTVLRSRLRQRDLARARYAGVFSKQLPELMDGPLTGWGKMLTLLPPFWFLLRTSGRVPGVGAEYRWLLRQPYLAPRDPGTLLGFAERLTIEQRRTEDPEQVLRLLVRAFLSDVSRAYRRPPWRPRGARRTTYPVVFLDGIAAANNGYRLLRLINDVRNDSGDFDPLLFVSAGREVPPDAVQPERSDDPSHPGVAAIPAAARAVDAYDDWCRRIPLDSRARMRTAWYLPVQVPPMPAVASGAGTGGSAYPPLAQDARRPPVFVVERPPFWARRWIAAITTLVLVAGLATGVYGLDRKHCNEPFIFPSAALLSRSGPGKDACVGITGGGYSFAPGDTRLTSIVNTISTQDAAALQKHHQNHRRPYLTLVYLAGFSGDDTPDNLVEQDLELAGLAALQQHQLGDDYAGVPLLNLLIASGGPDMAQYAKVAQLIGKAVHADPSIVGVIGLDQSKQNTKDLIGKLGDYGLPVVSATLSADHLGDASPLYFHAAPDNAQEAKALVNFAGTLNSGPGKQRGAVPRVTIVSPVDPLDLYCTTLFDDLQRDFARAHWAVTLRRYQPGTSGASGPEEVGEDLSRHAYPGLVVFAGRKDEFRQFIDGTQPNPAKLSIVADDDISSAVANPDSKNQLQGTTYWYVSFAYDASASNQLPYSYIQSEFRSNFGGTDPQVDGHAALAYAAGEAYVSAAQQQGLKLNPAVMAARLRNLKALSTQDKTIKVLRVDQSGQVSLAYPLQASQ